MHRLHRKTVALEREAYAILESMESTPKPPILDYATRPRWRVGKWFYVISLIMVFANFVGMVLGTSMLSGLHSLPPSATDIRRYILGSVIVFAPPTLGFFSGVLAAWQCEAKLARWAGWALILFHAVWLYQTMQMTRLFWPLFWP